MAGYHWFTDWGRDTMIAMRGLTIAAGKQDISKSILETFFSSVDKGMLPNRFPDSPSDPVEYNTIDATLLLFIALYEYHQKFQDMDFIKEHFYREGCILGISEVFDGTLPRAGKGTIQQAWSVGALIKTLLDLKDSTKKSKM